MKKQNGITLIALVVTIIVLLILATISVSVLMGNDGIINSSKDAKDDTEIAEEKEILSTATAQAIAQDVYGNIIKDVLQNELDKETGNGKTEVFDVGETLEVLFTETNRYYSIDKDGKIIDSNNIIIDKNPGDITKDENGNALDGSKNHPFEIWCIEDLVSFSNMVNGSGKKFVNGQVISIEEGEEFKQKYISLKVDLNFSSIFSYIDSERTDFGDLNGNINDGNQLMTEMTTGIGFSPIGYRNWKFNGTFNGENHTITNLYEKNRTDSDVLGLFGIIKNSTVQDVTVKGRIVTEGYLTDRFTSVGGIVGYGSGKIINCISDVEIDITGYGAAGILGREFENAEIINCVNLGTINNTTESTGGIVGRSEDDVKIYNCYNLGDINSNGYQVGGILGYGLGKVTITNVYNIGNIPLNGPQGRGGIIGSLGQSSLGADIKNAYNFGNIIENNVNWMYGAGGICGRLYNSSTKLNIENSYYLRSSCSKAVGAREDSEYDVEKREEINATEMQEVFNTYIQNSSDGTDTSEWKIWKIEEGQQYPIF